MWIVILMLQVAWATEAPLPFWKAKEKVYRRISNGEVIVVVKSAPLEGAGAKNHLKIEGGGQVNAPASFVFRKALDFDQLGKISGYIKSAKFDPQSEILRLEVGAFGYQSHMKMSLKSDDSRQPARIDFLVLDGAMKGLSGTFLFTSLAPKKSEVGIDCDFRYDQFPVPKLFLEFGLEVVFQRMALRLRHHVEEEFAK